MSLGRLPGGGTLTLVVAGSPLGGRMLLAAALGAPLEAGRSRGDAAGTMRDTGAAGTASGKRSVCRGSDGFVTSAPWRAGQGHAAWAWA